MKNYVMILAMGMLMAACGGSESGGQVDTQPGGSATTVADAPAGAESPTTAAQSSDTAPPANPPGGIVLTIGEQTWEFESAQCAFLNAEPGTDGSDWNVSNIKDGLQVYVNQNPSETRVTISDIANGGNPTLSWGTKNEEVTLTVSGNDIVAEGTFTDKVGGASPTQGRLEATCASWHEG